MKRDMNLVREILFAIEDAPYDRRLAKLNLGSKVEEEVVSYHVMLLAEAGLIEAQDLSARGGGLDWRPSRLTWEGHEFLEAARDQSRWVKATELMKEKGGGMIFDTLKGLLVKLATDAVFS